MVSKGYTRSLGFGLIEVMVVVGLVSILSLGIASLMTSTLNQSIEIKASITKGNLEQIVNRYAADPRTLYRSSLDKSNNSTRFKNCIHGISPPPPHPKLGASQCFHGAAASGVRLFDASGTQVSGPVGAPARFDFEGRPCTAASSRCIFEVESSFVADCGTFPTPCTSAQNITINYTIRQITENKLFKQVIGRRLAPVNGSVTSAVATILSNLSNNYLPMMNGGTTSLTNSTLFQSVDPATGQVKLGIGTTAPEATLDIAGDIAFTIGGKRFKTQMTNAGLKSRTGAGSYGEVTGLADTCDGSFGEFQCLGGVYKSTACFDIVSHCGLKPDCGGDYYNVTCNAAITWIEKL